MHDMRMHAVAMQSDCDTVIVRIMKWNCMSQLSEDVKASCVSYDHTVCWSMTISRWEVMHQLFLMFEDVCTFLRNNNDISIACRRKLLEISDDPLQFSLLQMELAATIDLGQHFVKVTGKKRCASL